MISRFLRHRVRVFFSLLKFIIISARSVFYFCRVRMSSRYPILNVSGAGGGLGGFRLVAGLAVSLIPSLLSLSPFHF